MILLCGHYCPQSRKVVQSLADHYGEFVDRSTAVVPVLPDSRGRAAVWERRYELPFELLADPCEAREDAGETASSDDGDDGTCFGAFTQFERAVTELPGVVLFQVDDDHLRFVGTLDDDQLRGGSVVEGALDAIDHYNATLPAGQVESGDEETLDDSYSSHRT